MPLIPDNNLSTLKKLEAARRQLVANESELTVTRNRQLQNRLKRTIKFLRRRIRKLEAACAAAETPPENSFFSKWWHANVKRR